MARKPTDKQLFKMKNEWLEQFYEREGHPGSETEVLYSDFQREF